MKAICENKKGSWTVGGEQAGQPEYFPLEIIRTPNGSLQSAWVPSWKDLYKMLYGAPIRVSVLSKKQPPILVMVDD